MVYADSKYNFFPITDEYKRNNYVLDNFVLDEASSRITYTDDVGEVHSKTGIDVSKHQGKIDWEKAVSYTHLDVYKRQLMYRNMSMDFWK